jgi:hypothetical protein
MKTLSEVLTYMVKQTKWFTESERDDAIAIVSGVTSVEVPTWDYAATTDPTSEVSSPSDADTAPVGSEAKDDAAGADNPPETSASELLIETSDSSSPTTSTDSPGESATSASGDEAGDTTVSNDAPLSDAVSDTVSDAEGDGPDTVPSVSDPLTAVTSDMLVNQGVGPRPASEVPLS